MKPGDKLDALVAKRVMGWPYSLTSDGCLVGIAPTRIWSPSTSIADAWVVLEKLVADGWSYQITTLCGEHCESGYPLVWFMRGDDEDGQCEHEAEVPASICLAALKAVGVEVE